MSEEEPIFTTSHVRLRLSPDALPDHLSILPSGAALASSGVATYPPGPPHPPRRQRHRPGPVLSFVIDPNPGCQSNTTELASGGPISTSQPGTANPSAPPVPDQALRRFAEVGDGGLLAEVGLTDPPCGMVAPHPERPIRQRYHLETTIVHGHRRDDDTRSGYLFGSGAPSLHEPAAIAKERAPASRK